MKIIHLDRYYTVDILTIHMETVHVDMYVSTLYRDSHPLVFARNTFLLVYLDNTCCQVNIIYTFRQMHPDILRDTTLKRSEPLHYSAAALKLRLDRPCTCPHLSSPVLTWPHLAVKSRNAHGDKSFHCFTPGPGKFSLKTALAIKAVKMGKKEFIKSSHTNPR